MKAIMQEQAELIYLFYSGNLAFMICICNATTILFKESASGSKLRCFACVGLSKSVFKQRYENESSYSTKEFCFGQRYF